jgi:dienelactone hydrolase
MTVENEMVRDVEIPAGDEIQLNGELRLPKDAPGLVVFAHGSGSSRFSPRNQAVAEKIREFGIGTLLFDLLTKDEEAVDIYTRHLRFDIGLLASRLVAVAGWLSEQTDTQNLRIGFFGSSTGGGAALVAASKLGERIGAVVSRGGRPDLAGDALPIVTAPTLMIVGELDDVVIELNRSAIARMHCETELKIIPGATHLFEEPGALDLVADLAGEWFGKHLRFEAAAAHA